MESQILSLISPIILIAIGIFLIAMESVFFSFILFWFGLASILIGLTSNIIGFDDGLWQIAAICTLAMILLFSLRTKAMKIFMKAKDDEIDNTFLNESGEGIIEQGKVKYKATYWDIDSSEKDFVDGEKVKVISALKNKAKIERIKDK